MSSAFMGRTMFGSFVRCRRPCARLSVRPRCCCTQSRSVPDLQQAQEAGHQAVVLRPGAHIQRVVVQVEPVLWPVVQVLPPDACVRPRQQQSLYKLLVLLSQVSALVLQEACQRHARPCRALPGLRDAVQLHKVPGQTTSGGAVHAHNISQDYLACVRRGTCSVLMLASSSRNCPDREGCRQADGYEAGSLSCCGGGSLCNRAIDPQLGCHCKLRAPAGPAQSISRTACSVQAAILGPGPVRMCRLVRKQVEHRA